MSRLNLDFDFDSLKQLHDSVNELLHSPDTKLEIMNQGQEKWAHEVSEASLKVADSCAAAKDVLLLAKDHLHDLHSAFRRISGTARKQGFTNGNSFAPYRLPRKQLKKAIMKRLNSLKGMSCITTTAAASPQRLDDRSLVVVMDLLKEVRDTTLLIVGSLLSLIAMPNPDTKTGSGRKDPVFRLKLTRVDSLSVWEKSDLPDVRTAAKKLEAVEEVVEDMEAELERIFRRLIRTRASLLNILTN